MAYAEHKEGSNIYYNIFPETRMVEARMDTRCMLDDVATIFAKRGILCPHKEFQKIINKMPNTLWGKAVCHPDDEWDVVRGKEIARARLLKKYYRYRLEMFKCAADYIDKSLTHCEDYMNFSWLSYNKFNDIIKNSQKFDEN